MRKDLVGSGAGGASKPADPKAAAEQSAKKAAPKTTAAQKVAARKAAAAATNSSSGLLSSSEPSVAATTAYVADTSAVTSICGMGFEPADAGGALEMAGPELGVQGAIELLLSGWRSASSGAATARADRGAAQHAHPAGKTAGDGAKPSKAKPWKEAGEGWTYMRGQGLVTWLFLGPDGRQFTREAEALAEVARIRRGTIVSDVGSPGGGQKRPNGPAAGQRVERGAASSGADARKKRPKLTLVRPKPAAAAAAAVETATEPPSIPMASAAVVAKEPEFQWLPGTLAAERASAAVRDPTTWIVLQKDGPNHLGSRHDVLPAHQMAPITSGCVPFRRPATCRAARRQSGRC